MATQLKHTLSPFLAILFLQTTVQAELTHRYSFSEKNGVADFVGHVNGKLVGGASIEGGKLVLKNDGKNSDDAALQYVEFDQSILPKTGSVSLVFWFTASESGAFARVLNFGDQEDGSGKAFIYFTPRTADDNSRAAITATDAGAKTAVDNDRLDDGKSHMVAIVIDGGTKKMHVFIDGKESKAAEDLGENTLDKVHAVKSWLGRSGYDSDAGFTGSIDELRVYDHALSPAEVAASAASGANKLPR